MTDQDQKALDDATKPPNFRGVGHYFEYGIVTAVKIHNAPTSGGGVEITFRGEGDGKGIGLSRGIFIGAGHTDYQPALDYLCEMGFLHHEADTSLVDKLTKGDSDVE